MLPVLEIADQIVKRLRTANRLVLTAPTGSGKTTQVPQIVFRSGIVPAHEQIIVLQPRRLATRMVAARVAKEMGCAGGLGGLVGYQTRHDSAVSSATRIRFMTEGLMLRLLQSDPTLKDVGCVILDEFHERNLPADISLGLLAALQERAGGAGGAGGRSDLKLMVMSATLDAKAVAAYLRCDALEAGGRLHPVEISYLAKPVNAMTEPVWEQAAKALRSVVDASDAGDVLIFMPGVYEITRTIEACQKMIGPDRSDVRFFPLHGSLTPAQQDAATEPNAAPHRIRKVIVATNVAETSITIDGIRFVIDSGLARIHRFDPRRGLNALRVEPISKASADQRAGRAGRTGPGACMRLWTSKDHGTRADHDEPEVHRLDLSEAMLTLMAMGVNDVAKFGWLQPPTAESLTRANALLRDLGAINAGVGGTITSDGRVMAEFPAHPRLARIMLDASKRGCLRRAITWAAIINERDIFQQTRQSVLLRFVEKDEPLSDIAACERAFEMLREAKFDGRRCGDIGANGGACRDVDRTATQFAAVCRRLKMSFDGPNRTEDLIKSLLTAFRDHLAVKIERERPNCAMPGRRKVMLDKESVVRDAGPLIALEMSEIGRGDSAQTMLAMASHVDPAWLLKVDPDGFATRHELMWNAQQQSVEAVEQQTYRDLVLEQTVRPPQSPTDLDAAAAMIVERIIAGELKLEGWNEKAEQWLTRARCVAKWFPERGMITYDADDVRLILHEIVGRSARFNQVRDRPCLDFVRNGLDWEEQRFIEKMAPESIALPNGWHMRIEYALDAPPRGRAKIQDLYDLNDTPRIAGGRQTVLLEILGPNRRPVQVTSDLNGFWTILYPELKKELKRRYPRHEWR